jgi:hypothetical protein
VTRGPLAGGAGLARPVRGAYTVRRKPNWTSFCIAAAGVSLCTAATLAQAPATQAAVESDRPRAETASAPAAKLSAPKPGPRYFDLRYDEDFSYLDGPPDSYQKDFFDPIKNIHLGRDWRLTLGGEIRNRMEAETNRAYGAVEPAQDTFDIYRFLLHADLKYRRLFRVFVQGIAAFDEKRDLPIRPVDENWWDVHQLFLDFRFLGEEQPWTVRVGRQELSYGNERIVSALDWANVRRRFDGVKIFARTTTWDLDAWYAKPVVVQRKQHDRYDEDFDFYGLYATYKGIPRHGIDAYFLAVDDTGNRRNPNGRSGDKDVYTFGSRLWGKTAGFDYETELAGQFGHWAGDRLCAWSLALDGGYTFETVPLKPRIGAGFDWATGDEDAEDSTVQTFDQLFPLGHKYLGFLDLIGRQNITASNVNLSFWPVDKVVRTAVAYHTFWLSENEDFLYDAAGVPGRRDPTGGSGTEVGHELDLTISWKIDVHSALLLGYSHFWDSDFIISTGPSEDADLFYVQYLFRF